MIRKTIWFQSLSFFLVLVLLFCFFPFYSFAEGTEASSDPDLLLAEGMRLLSGDGVEQNLLKGLSLIKEAADKGSAKAMLEIGIMYSSGFGKLLSPDFEPGNEAELALLWYEKAAQAGEQEAAASVIASDAFSYFLGSEDRSIQEDDAVALQYFKKAAEYGDPSATNMMIAFYTYGFGVEQDSDKALELGAALVDRGDEEALYAMEEYAYAYYSGTKEGIDINFSTAFQYYLKLTEYGNERAMYNVALLYEYGLGVSQDHEQALDWLNKALNAGYEPAKTMLDKLNKQ